MPRDGTDLRIDAQGRVEVAGRVVEAWTLISPYPDETMTTLRQGTLLIVLTLDPRTL